VREAVSLAVKYRERALIEECFYVSSVTSVSSLGATVRLSQMASSAVPSNASRRQAFFRRWTVSLELSACHIT